MRKLFKTSEQGKLDNVYDKLQSKRKSIKFKALIMVLLLFGVNIFAWFTYISKADLNFDAEVIAWDVNFYNDTTEINNMIIEVGEIYPGFGDKNADSNNEPYKKTITVGNSGEVSGSFSYLIEGFTIMGRDAINGDYDNNEILDLMRDTYPFTIKLDATADKIAPGESLNFIYELYWLYEDANKYFRLNQVYTYDPSLVYYTYSNNNYAKADVNENNFLALRDSLYLQKDDADSYFGSKCVEYEATTGKKCVSTKVKLKVSQILE